MTITSSPSLRASASGSWLVVPQSTVTRSFVPRSASDWIACTFGPYPSKMRSGIWISGSMPAMRRNRPSNAVDVAPPGNFGYTHGIYLDRAGDLYVADPIADDAHKPPTKFALSGR